MEVRNMAMLVDNEFGTVEFVVPSVESIARSLPPLCIRGTKLKALKPCRRTRSLVKKALDAAHDTQYKSQAQCVSVIAPSGTSPQGSNHQERTWRDLERTVVGNQVRWTCKVTPPTVTKTSNMLMHCPPDDIVEGCTSSGVALDTISNSPTSTLTVDTDRNNVSVVMSDYGLDPFPSSPLQMQDVGGGLMDVSGPLRSNGYSAFDLELSSPDSLPMISPELEATEDYNSCGSGASENQWSAGGDLAAFDGMVLQDPDCRKLNPEPDPLDKILKTMCQGTCEMLEAVPAPLAEQQTYQLPFQLSGMHDVIDQHLPVESSLSTGAVEGKVANDLAQDKVECGLELVQELWACARAIAGGEFVAARHHAERLSHLISPKGSSMERVATYFTEALGIRAWLGYQGSYNNVSSERSPVDLKQVLFAYQTFYTSCPYLIVTHFAANQAILEAFEVEEKVHIVDLDIKQGLQWPSLIQALSERPRGPPQLRITVVVGMDPHMDSVVATKKRLLDFADMFGVPLEYNIIKDDVESLQPWMLGIRKNEALAVNCVSSLHRLIDHPRTSIDSFLLMIHRLEPSVVTIVEQDANHDQEFFPRFMDALHYYSSMFDSLAASSLGSSGSMTERKMVERLLLGKDIMDIVGREGKERRARHQTAELWIQRMTDLGFRLRPLSSRSILQAKCLLGMYPISKYCITSEDSYLSLGWQDKPLYCVSSWCS